tara:strand:- start:543 stop:1277 length:735 start_codon:yes stop_codon:yes gene_type:complete
MNDIDNFYKLKEKYDNIILKQKEKISNKNTLTKKEKQKEFKNLEFKCINCNKIGGTIFEITNKKLIALCNAKNKCDLNINIDKNTYYNIQNEKTDVEDEINLIKSEIMKTKLDYLFKFIEEKDAINKFNEKKIELNELNNYLIIVKKDYINIVNNIEKNNLLKKNKINLHNKILEITDLEKKYMETKNTQLIDDIISIYKTDILPINKEIRNLKYSYFNVIKDDDDNNKIIQLPYTLDMLYLEN